MDREAMLDDLARCFMRSAVDQLLSGRDLEGSPNRLGGLSGAESSTQEKLDGDFNSTDAAGTS
jgi:hypothetical protein